MEGLPPIPSSPIPYSLRSEDSWHWAVLAIKPSRVSCFKNKIAAVHTSSRSELPRSELPRSEFAHLGVAEQFNAPSNNRITRALFILDPIFTLPIFILPKRAHRLARAMGAASVGSAVCPYTAGQMAIMPIWQWWCRRYLCSTGNSSWLNCVGQSEP